MNHSASDIKSEAAFYRKKFLLSIIIPSVMVLFMWLVKITETLFEADLTSLGIYPLEAKGLPGIILSPFIHEKHINLWDVTRLRYLNRLLVRATTAAQPR